MDMTFSPDPFSRAIPDPLDDTDASFAPGHRSGGDPALSESADLSLVLEKLAGWLAQPMPVALAAYWNPRLRNSHLLNLAPVADREMLEETVRGVIDGAVPRIRHWRQRQWFFHLWMGTPLEAWEHLLIVEENGLLSVDECNLLLQEAARLFGPALRHGSDSE